MKRGLSKQQVCVVTSIDDTGASFLVVSGRRMLGKERTYKALNGRIGKGILVVTDKAGAYPTVLERLGATLERRDATVHAINRINSLHARLKDFMHGFKGVSTRHPSPTSHGSNGPRRSRTDPPNNRALSDASFVTACTVSRAASMCVCPCPCVKQEHDPYQSDGLRCNYQFDWRTTL